MSKREAPVAIISMAQQARPNVIGHMLDSRAQLMACSSDVVNTLSSKRPSSHPMSYSCPEGGPHVFTSSRLSVLGFAADTPAVGGACENETLRTQARSPRRQR